jgi:hypothetical protein
MQAGFPRDASLEQQRFDDHRHHVGDVDDPPDVDIVELPELHAVDGDRNVSANDNTRSAGRLPYIVLGLLDTSEKKLPYARDQRAMSACVKGFG